MEQFNNGNLLQPDGSTMSGMFTYSIQHLVLNILESTINFHTF